VLMLLYFIAGQALVVLVVAQVFRLRSRHWSLRHTLLATVLPAALFLLWAWFWCWVPLIHLAPAPFAHELLDCTAPPWHKPLARHLPASAGQWHLLLGSPSPRRHRCPSGSLDPRPRALLPPRLRLATPLVPQHPLASHVLATPFCNNSLPGPPASAWIAL
jgi:hypothetical protein